MSVSREIYWEPLDLVANRAGAKVDMVQVRAATAIVDNVSHYSWPDVFELRGSGKTVFGNPQRDEKGWRSEP